jgi:poly(A) polymerase Pap1
MGRRGERRGYWARQINNWRMVPENVALDTFLQIFGIQNRTASNVEEIVAFVAHARVPDFGIGFPGITGKLIRVVGHRLCFTIKKK